jgi:hypothetical protein
MGLLAVNFHRLVRTDYAEALSNYHPLNVCSDYQAEPLALPLGNDPNPSCLISWSQPGPLGGSLSRRGRHGSKLTERFTGAATAYCQ